MLFPRKYLSLLDIELARLGDLKPQELHLLQATHRLYTLRHDNYSYEVLIQGVSLDEKQSAQSLTPFYAWESRPSWVGVCT